MQPFKLSISKVCLLTLYFITPITGQRILESNRKVAPAAKSENNNDSSQKESSNSAPLLSLNLVAPSQSSQPPAPSSPMQSSASPNPAPTPSSNPQPDNNGGDKDSKPNSQTNENPPSNNVVTTIFRPFTNIPTGSSDSNPAPTPGSPPSGAPSTGNPSTPNNTNNGNTSNPDLSNPNGNPASSTSGASDSGFNTILYAGIGVGVVVLAALVGIFILRKWKFSPTDRFKNKLTPDVYRQRTYESDHQFLRDLHGS